ncbi:hypothetical protein RYX36_035097 [Vicia faba]
MHAYCSFHNKTKLTLSFNQTHISKTVKAKEAHDIKHAKALDEVKRLFVSQSTDERLSMVDSIQRLGIEYHFEDQIEATLQRKYTMLRFHRIQELSQVAFQFRMLRQQGYYIRPG